MKVGNMEIVKKVMLSLIILVVTASIIIHVGPKNAIVGKTIDNPVEDIMIPSNIVYEIQNGESIIQSFIPEYAYMTELRTIMLHTGEDVEGELQITIKDESGNVILNKSKDLDEIKPGEWSRISINRQVKEGKNYELEFTIQNAQNAIAFLVCNSAFGLEEETQALYKGESIAGSLLLSFAYKETKSILFRSIVCILLAVAAGLSLFMIFAKNPLQKLKKITLQEGDLQKTVYWIGMFLCAILIVFVHCYKILEVPYGIHVDEMGSGYDAYCLANWGVDRFQMSFPVYFVNIGTGQNALYAYMAAILFKLFGYSLLMLRIPAIINAFLTVFFGAKIVKMKWKNRKSVLIFLALYAILPYFIMSTRFGLESYLLLGFAALFLYTLLYAVKQKKIIWYVISGLCGGILLYTYAISYLVMILFLACTLCFLVRTKQITGKQVVAFTIPLVIVAMPLVLCQIINMFDLPEIKIGLMTITKLEGYRGSEISFKHVIANALTTLKSVFFYDTIHYNSFPEYFTMYWVSIPFILIGICHASGEAVQNIKKRKWDVSTVMLIWFLSMFLVGCLLGGNGPNCNKVNGIYISCIFFLVEGIFCIARIREREKWANGVLVISILSYIVCFTTFADYYFYRYAKDYYPEDYFEMTYGQALEILDGAGEEIAGRTTYIEEYSPIYFCGSTLISPYEFPYENGMTSYKNYIFHYGGEQDLEANYILKDTSKDVAIQFEKQGFLVQKIPGWYVCYKLIME